MTMQITPDTDPADHDDAPTPKRRPTFLLAAAAALVAIAVAAIAVVVANREEVPADQPPITTVPAPDTEASALPTRSLEADELVFVGTYRAELTGDFGPGALEITLGDDGTFETTSAGDLCATQGTWGLGGEQPGFVLAEGRCGDVTVNLEASARPERLTGTVTSSDATSVDFDAEYQPATLDRPLTDEELAYVGEWAQLLYQTGDDTAAETTLTLSEDGTFFGPEASSFFSELRGHWEITPTGLLSLSGGSGGFAIRVWGTPNPEVIDLEWSSSNGQARQVFDGTSTLERND